MTAGNVLMELLQNPKEPLGLSRHSGAVLADWLEEALLSTSRQKSGEIHDAIVQLYQNTLTRCSTDVQLATQASSKADLKLRESYQMGILSLAQLLVAQGLDRKISIEFTDVLKDPANAMYIVALYEREHSNKELAKIVAQTEENVSRKLRKFREIGVSSSKKVGTTVFNSLTVTARQLVEELGLQNNRRFEVSAILNNSAMRALESKKVGVEPFMQSQMCISRPSLRHSERLG